VLLIQSVTGRSVGLISLFGVVLLAAGFVVFLAALSWQGLPASPVIAGPGAPGPDVAPREAPSPAPSAPSEPDVPPTQPIPSDTPAAAVQQAIPTERLSAESPLVGASCAVCGQRLAADQIVLRCPECRSVQHAHCWTDNGFACGIEGCLGAGSLAAPAHE
jgi:hypothetical protein